MADLISRWRDCSLATPPYILPGDEVLLHERRWTHPFHSFAEYAASPALAAPDDLLHPGLLPVPFMGDLQRARIYLLMLNPGFRPASYYAEEQSAEYRQALLRNLRQEHGGELYPFVSLDPQFAWHGGFTYWHTRLGPWAAELSLQRGCSHQEALSVLARSICVLQLVPYRSSRFGLPVRVVKQLASVRLALEYVRDALVPRAQAGEALIVATRSGEHWRLPEHENMIVYQGSERRSAHLSRNTRGGRAIARHLGLTSC